MYSQGTPSFLIRSSRRNCSTELHALEQQLPAETWRRRGANLVATSFANNAVAVAALRDLQEQLAKSEQNAASLRREVDKANENARAIQKTSDGEATKHATEVSKLRQLIIELKDALHQTVQVNKFASSLPASSRCSSAILHADSAEIAAGSGII